MTDPIPNAPRPSDRADPETAPTKEPHSPDARPHAAVQRAAAGVADVVSAVGGTREALHVLTEPVVRRTRQTVDEAVLQWRNREAARIRHLRALNKEPLPNMFDVYPEARSAATHPLGLVTIPVDEIRGTAVEGPDMRGRDFLPLRAFRTRNWEARWQRLRQAMAELVTLPPIEVLNAGAGYWVEDGHNRVAAALYTGQVDIDAVVTQLRLEGDAPDEPAGSLAPLLAEAEEMRAAGQGSRMPHTSSEAGTVSTEQSAPDP